jgi:hypothetical protein
MWTGLKSSLISLLILTAVTHGLAQVENGDINSRCPLGALRDGGADSVPSLNWRRIRSDEHAVACLSEIASDLGPERTKAWLEQNRFSAMFIKSFIPGNRDNLLSASWPVKRNGLLYYPGVLIYLQARYWAYSQVFTFRWDENNRLLMVSQSRVFK